MVLELDCTVNAAWRPFATAAVPPCATPELLELDSSSRFFGSVAVVDDGRLQSSKLEPSSCIDNSNRSSSRSLQSHNESQKDSTEVARHPSITSQADSLQGCKTPEYRIEGIPNFLSKQGLLPFDDHCSKRICSGRRKGTSIRTRGRISGEGRGRCATEFCARSIDQPQV